MTRFLSVLLWTTVFVLLLAGIDQLLVRVPATLPAHVAVADFYRDLRSRMIGLAAGRKGAPPAAVAPKEAPEVKGKGKAPAPPAPTSVEAVIATRQSGAASVPPAKPLPSQPGGKAPSRTPGMRYVYADDGGEIHFAETLAEIPEPYRGKARALGE